MSNVRERRKFNVKSLVWNLRVLLQMLLRCLCSNFQKQRKIKIKRKVTIIWLNTSMIWIKIEKIRKDMKLVSMISGRLALMRILMIKLLRFVKMITNQLRRILELAKTKEKEKVADVLLSRIIRKLTV